ncbi:MAG: anaerobic ribonucleoside triphosphate reductase [Erysipelotrichaceae bacterium]|nr:anaerobic ribonucleoside triphosphate reductase [Erysipelotrichaceae bacterium]
MVNKIIKRDGRKEIFNSSKIYEAISKAADSCNLKLETNIDDVVETVLEKVNNEYSNKNIPTVENIQDIIEMTLIEKGYGEIAKAYIVYRAKRTEVRETKSKLMQTMADLTFQDSKNNDDKRENANIDADTPMGTMLKYGSESSKAYYLSHLLKPKFAEAHKSGDIHIHDLDFYALTLTCCQIDPLTLFKGGFATGHGFLREPNDIRSYAALACIAIQANQNDMHGGQAIPNFDYAMAPGVRKTYRKTIAKQIVELSSLLDDNIDEDKLKEEVLALGTVEDLYKISNVTNIAVELVKLLTKYFDKEKAERVASKALKNAYKETRKATFQAMEALVHNLNTMHSRAGAQVPFSSLNYGTDTSPEGRMVVDCLLDTTEDGLGRGETPIFPIQIFKVKEGINYNPGDPNYDLFKKSIKVSAKRLFPNFSFMDAPFNLQYYKEGDPNTEVAYMGCRTRVMGNTYDKTKEQTYGRGNLSFTSVNLPRLALKTKNIDLFFKELEKTVEMVIEQLLDRLEIQSQRKVYNFPFLMGQGVWIGSDKLKWNDSIREVIKHGTLSVGFIGLAETLKVLTGKHHGESEESQQLGIKIIGRMRELLDEAANKYQLNFSLLATPAEGLSGRFVRIDKKLFGEIPGVTDRDFYTNSFHIPVYHKISAFEKIKKEAPYHAFTNAGHISYIEFDGDAAKNLSAFEKVIRAMKENGIGYGAVNHPVDRDPVCGFNGIIDNVCPGCGRHEDDVKFERIRRITGYLVGTLDRFNNGKKAEEKARVKHGCGDSTTDK